MGKPQNALTGSKLLRKFTEIFSMLHDITDGVITWIVTGKWPKWEWGSLFSRLAALVLLTQACAEKVCHKLNGLNKSVKTVKKYIKPLRKHGKILRESASKGRHYAKIIRNRSPLVAACLSFGAVVVDCRKLGKAANNYDKYQKNQNIPEKNKAREEIILNSLSLIANLANIVGGVCAIIPGCQVAVIPALAVGTAATICKDSYENREYLLAKISEASKSILSAYHRVEDESDFWRDQLNIYGPKPIPRPAYQEQDWSQAYS